MHTAVRTIGDHRLCAAAPQTGLLADAGLEAAAPGAAMKNPTPRLTRCAVYTRKSTEHNLDLAFTSLKVL